LGFVTDIDEDALAAVAAHFKKIAAEENLPLGAPLEYDLFHFEHQVPGGMMTNLTRQLREVGMDQRLGEILPEVIRVRKEFGYPVMATPYSQIVGAQAVENVISGERYKNVTDEAIKYALGYYGKPVVPLDPNVMERIMNLPRTKEFLNWKPEGYLRSVEELRNEIGPELSDDDLLLKILIPGKTIQRSQSGEKAGAPAAQAAVAATPVSGRLDFPSQFQVDVDGDVFNVKISPVWGHEQKSAAAEMPEPERGSEIPEGAVLCGMAGLVLSIEVKAGDRVGEGDLLATIEAMKMRRRILASRKGVVKEVRAREGEIVNSGDVLAVLE